jgi:1,4-alpha-glucan branching enzyme
MEGMMFKKQYLKTRDVCKVTFRVFKNQVGPARVVRLVGEFNSWDVKAEPMNRLKSGDFTCRLDLKPEKAYQFRYLVNDEQWMNDEDADAYLPSPFPGVDNSVIAL